MTCYSSITQINNKQSCANFIKGKSSLTHVVTEIVSLPHWLRPTEAQIKVYWSCLLFDPLILPLISSSVQNQLWVIETLSSISYLTFLPIILAVCLLYRHDVRSSRIDM